jgi:tetratricopeptide (TPR) repeat protein
LGFTVEKIMNGNLEQMENAVSNLKRKLGGSSNSYGFFFYAGHGVQANGENYLIPVEANNILNETHLRQRAVSLQFVLDSLNEAGNHLNMVVLDACRDNPFGWARSGSRGLSVVSQAPRGSIVMYATGANSVASDGTGKNGLFTGHLLNNLKTAGLSVYEIFDKTMGDVSSATSGKQEPELSLRFSGAHTVYLGTRPSTPAPTPAPQPAPVVTPVAPLPPPPVSTKTAKDYYDSGKAFYDRKDYTTAIDEFTAAIRLDPNYADAYYYRGIAYYENKDHDRAIADYTQAIKLNPNYALAYYNRGNAYYRKNDYDRAIADYTQAIKLNPNYALAYYNRGIAYEKKGDMMRADADRAKARLLGYRP